LLVDGFPPIIDELSVSDNLTYLDVIGFLFYSREKMRE
jgi:hypothetical protein